MNQTVGLVWTAAAEVDSPDPARAAACVAAHPNQPCPGWPHDDEEQQ